MRRFQDLELCSAGKCLQRGGARAAGLVKGHLLVISYQDEHRTVLVLGSTLVVVIRLEEMVVVG